MKREELINKMYNKPKYIGFQYDKLWHPPMCNYITQYDINNLREIALDVKLSSNPKRKYMLMDQIMQYRGFTRLHAGTNRLVYKSEYDPTIVLKVGIDRTGITDNPSELANQIYLKPFCCKVFEVSNCGTVAMVERVNAIRNRNQFEEIASTVFDIIMTKFRGMVLEDIGSNFFMNWGMREGFGPVLLDYPYAYLIDEDKLTCHHKDKFGIECLGYVDYDDGLNTLICERCGKRYTARSLSKTNNFIKIEEQLKKERTISMERITVSITSSDGKKYEYSFGDEAIPKKNLHEFYEKTPKGQAVATLIESNMIQKEATNISEPVYQSTFIRKSAETIINGNIEIIKDAQKRIKGVNKMNDELKEELLDYFRKDVQNEFNEKFFNEEHPHYNKGIFTHSDAKDLINLGVEMILENHEDLKDKEEEIRSILLIDLYSNEHYNITEDENEDEEIDGEIDDFEEAYEEEAYEEPQKRQHKKMKKMISDF